MVTILKMNQNLKIIIGMDKGWKLEGNDMNKFMIIFIFSYPPTSCRREGGGF